jgi:hypothetical protein
VVYHSTDRRAVQRSPNRAGTFHLITMNAGQRGETRAERDLREQLAAQATATEATAAPAIDPRLYVQFGLSEERAQAEQFRAKAQGLTLAGRRLDVPGVELVASAPSRTELRCFYETDCALAEELRGKLQALTGQRIAISRQVGRYPTSRARPLHFELWFAAGSLEGGSRPVAVS